MADENKTNNAPEAVAKADLSRKEQNEKLRALKKQKKAHKKQLKKLYKEYQESKKTVPVNKRPIICPPDRSAAGNGRLIAGYAVRGFIIFVAVFAVVFFMCDAFGISRVENGVKAGYIALWSFLLTAILTAACVIPERRIAVPCGIAAVSGITLLMLLPDPVRVVYEAALHAFNTALAHLTSVGYLAMDQKSVEVSLTTGDSLWLLKRAVFLAILVISIIYVLSLVRRIRLVPFFIAAAVSAGILWLVFTYNVSRSNWGVVLVIASFSALLVMFAYDRLYIKKPRDGETDTDSGMFGSDDAPALPEAYLSKKREKAEKKAARLAAKQAKKTKRKQKKNGTAPAVTVEEELTDYFSDGKKKNRPAKEKKPKVHLTPAQKREAKAQKKLQKKEKQLQKAADRRAVRAYRAFRGRILDAKCATGGFAAAGMFVICMVLLFIPALTVTGPYNTIEALDKKIKPIREYVTAILMGDDPTLDLLAYERDSSNFAPRSTEPKTLYFTGKKLMTVESNARYNIYLRGWTATDYDDETGCWTTADPDSETFALYRSLFGTTIDPSELMMYDFYRLIDSEAIPSAEERDYSTKIKSNTSLGFIVAQVNMKRTEDLTSKLLYMPSYTVRDFNIAGKTSSGKKTVYLRAYGSSEASKITYANYFDGIYTSYRASKDTDGYATVAMITNMKVTGFYRTLADNIAAIQLTRDAILNGGPSESVNADGKTVYTLKFSDGTTLSYRIEYRTEDGSPAHFTTDAETGEITYQDDDGFVYIVTDNEVGEAEYKLTPDGELKAKNVINIPEDKLKDEDGDDITYIAPSFPYVIRYYEFLPQATKDMFSYYCLVSDYYTNYVYQTYTQPSSSTAVRELTDKIVSEATVKDSEEYTETDPETGEVYELLRYIDVPADFSLAAEHNEYEKVIKDAKKETYEYALTSAVTDTDVYRQRHQLVMEFINYLTDEENFTYTLTPTLSADESLVGIEKFLETREGYCTQFATTLVLMLRNQGIPARFVDGYIASNLHNNYDKEKAASYTTTVRDNNAHAWVEVWFDGIGWVQYEATPEYYSSMYETQSDSGGSSHVTPSGDDTDEEETDEYEGLTDEEIAELIRQQEEEARRAMIRKIIRICIIVAACIAAVAIVFFYFYKRAQAARKKRDALLAKFSATHRSEAAPTPTREEVRKLSDLITRLLAECGLSPKAGEFRDTYAERLAAYNPGALATAVKSEGLTDFEAKNSKMKASDILRMLDAMSAEEFGYGAAREDMYLLSRFYLRMYAYEYSRHVFFGRRIWLWLFRREM